MDFFQKLSESLKFTLKHKSLWGLGFLLSLFGVGVHYNFPINLDSRQGLLNNLPAGYSQAYDQLNSAFHTPTGVMLMIVLTLIGILVAFLIWYITSISRGGLIRAVVHSKHKEEIDFGKSWHEGGHFAFRLMGLDVVIGVIAILLFVPALILLIISAALPILLCLTIPLFVIYLLVVAVAIALTHTGAEKYLVIKNVGVMKSINAGMKMAQKHLVDYILGFLVSLLPGLAWAVVMFFVWLILLIPGVIVSAANFQNQPWILVGLTVIASLGSAIITAIVNSPYIVFTNTYWTEIVMEFINKD